MRSKVIKEEPYTDNTVKVHYEGGGVGFRGINEPSLLPPEPMQHDNSPASSAELGTMIQDSNEMMKKYADQLRSKYPVSIEMPKKKRIGY